MPLVLNVPSGQGRGKYLKGLFEKTFLTDIMERHDVRHTEDLGNGSSLRGGVSGVSRNTVAEYIRYTEDAFLVQTAKRFDIRGKDYMSGQRKHYFSGLGLRNARLNYRQFDRPRLLENAVYNELVSRGYSVDEGRMQTRVKMRLENWQRNTWNPILSCTILRRRCISRWRKVWMILGKKNRKWHPCSIFGMVFQNIFWSIKTFRSIARKVESASCPSQIFY